MFRAPGRGRATARMQTGSPFLRAILALAMLPIAAIALPAASSPTAPALEVFASGLINPRGLAFLDGQLYVLTAAGGWDIGDPDFHSAILRVGMDGSLTTVFDYSAWAFDHPNRARLEDPRADVPMGMPFGLAALGDRLYTTDGNWEQVLSIDPATGLAARVADYPRSNRALTGIAAGPAGRLSISTGGSAIASNEPFDGQILRLALS